MKILMTNKCTLDCPECQQKGWFLTDNEIPVQSMPIGLFREIVQKFRMKDLFLAGGEILKYKYLAEALQICFQSGVKPILSTTLMTDPRAMEKLIRDVGHLVFAWDIGLVYPDDKKDLFMENLNNILLCHRGPLNLSVTLLPDREKIQKMREKVEEVFDTLSWNMYPPIELNFSNCRHGHGYQSFDYTDSLIDFADRLNTKYHHVEFMTEQYLLPCELGERFFEKKLVVLLKHFEFLHQCEDPEICVLPDGSAIYCYALPDVRVNDIIKLSGIEELDDMLTDMYRKKENQTEYLTQCRKCEHFSPAECFGYCLAKKG